MEVSSLDGSTGISVATSTTPPLKSVNNAENGVEAESRKLPSSRFKGVVPQPHGRWGSQIYEKHQRVWLGTFNHEEDAARAYDTAVLRFRGCDAVTNFSDRRDHLESAFLNSLSKSEIVDMLRKHTYGDELGQSRRNHSARRSTATADTEFRFSGVASEEKPREKLFEKVVTPSDVGKLNRLVIPKHHAEKHFPLQNGNFSNGVLLDFEDPAGKVWRFRYSYWSSSQSYVLTKGWIRFVKEKNLRAGDIVSFQRVDKQLHIDYKLRKNEPNVVGLLGRVQTGQVFRLFGVNIFEGPMNGGCGGKRVVEMEINSNKKQRVIDAL